MGVLSDQMISEFVKITYDNKKENKEETLFGTVVHQGKNTFVRFDGSELLTPVGKTTATANNDRVIVSLKNHNATVIGNLSDPSAGNKFVGDLSNRFDTIEADNVIIHETLIANKIVVDDLVANNITVNGRLDATEANIEELRAKKLDVEDADIKYANIDFANIGKAAIENLYAKSGLIKDLVVGDQMVTGELVGVTISGDLIKANTLKADKLVLKGTDGLYYQLNFNGVKIEDSTATPQTDENSINGSLIQAKSIVATQINVKDLVAFDATIGGMHITESSLYSGVKESVLNTTRGIYLDDKGQAAFGDSNNFLKFYEDPKTKEYRLEISASSLKFVTSDTTVESELGSIHEQMSQIKEELVTVIKIEPSNGTAFRNNKGETKLNAVVYRGSSRIVDIGHLRKEIGLSAKIEWSWKRLTDDTFGLIQDNDPRITNDGFTFSVTPDDVKTRTVFMCSLVA